MQGRVLTIAGSDSGAGAGIQADIKTAAALGGYATTAITAITAQNTQEVRSVHPCAPETVRQQIEAVLDDIGTDAIKTGMVCNAGIITTIADTLTRYSLEIPLVVDPVMVASSGGSLLQQDAITALKDKLFPLADLITPNVPEAEALLGITIPNRDAMEPAARQLAETWQTNILLKGGHLEGSQLVDILVMEQDTLILEAPAIPTRHIHGTGCTLATAIATGLAQHLSLPQAVRRAHAYVQEAILWAPGFGQGYGPLGH